MKRFILSTFSILLATGAMSLGAGFANAPIAQALPKTDPAFNLQTRRLSEFDARNKSEEAQQSYDYQQPSTDSTSQNVSVEQSSAEITEPTTWEKPAEQEEISSPAPSITQRRHELLDRS